MTISNDFLEYVLDQFTAWGEVIARKMFGGAGLYRDGKMFGLAADDVVYLKVDETNRGKFIAAGSAPFKPFTNRPTILSFFEIPPDIFESPEELIAWSKESLIIQKKREMTESLSIQQARKLVLYHSGCHQLSERVAQLKPRCRSLNTLETKH